MITPIPPVQCVKQRQTRILGGKSLKESAVVTPVVEKPETLSKTAAIGSVGVKNKYGSAPITHTQALTRSSAAKEVKKRGDSASCNQRKYKNPYMLPVCN